MTLSIKKIKHQWGDLLMIDRFIHVIRCRSFLAVGVTLSAIPQQGQNVPGVDILI